VATPVNEKDFIPVADKLLEGNRDGAIEKATELVLGIVTGHPIVGALGGRLAKVLAQALATGYVDSATQRLLDAGREWDDSKTKSEWLGRQIVLAVGPLAQEQNDAQEERFLQTLRYIERNVASASAVEEVLAEIRALGERIAARAALPRESEDVASPHVAIDQDVVHEACGVPDDEAATSVFASMRELREWMVEAFSPEELEVFVADVLPASGGLRRIVSSVHLHEF
jgi:hypothetical protein